VRAVLNPGDQGDEPVRLILRERAGSQDQRSDVGAPIRLVDPKNQVGRVRHEPI
jgi:hypothetical protein